MVRPSLPSQIYGKDIIDSAPVIELPPLTSEEIGAFRSRHQSQSQFKTYIGMNRDISVNTVRDGRWTSPAPRTRVWAVSLLAHEAKGIRIHFQNFNLPIGARLFVYGPGHENAPEILSGRGLYANGDFWSSVILGEQVRFEYLAPDGANAIPDASLFAIAQISHLIADPRATVSDWEVAGACNLDATCYPTWKTEEESVGRILGNDSEGLFGCSGVLLNNQANDGAPFFLTANHCFQTDAVAQTADVFWDYATTTCGQTETPDPNGSPQTNGASLLTTTFVEDSSLLLLNGPPASDATFSGWSTTYPAVGSNMTAIHHPAASWRRISFGKTGPRSLPDYPDFIEVWWSQGVLEPGSSGGPGFNDSHQVVGIVSRGGSSCSSPGSADYFAPFANAYAALNATGTHNYLVNGGPDDSYAPNQTRATAASLALPLAQTWLVLKSSAPDDWYKIHVPAGTQMEVDLTSTNDPPNFEYYVGNSDTPTSPASSPFIYSNPASDVDLHLHIGLPTGQQYMRYALTTAITNYSGPTIGYISTSVFDPYTLDFNATMISEGLSVLTWFEYSTDPSLASNVLKTPPITATSGSPLQTRADANPQTTYYWRAVAQDAAKTAYSQIGTVTTPKALPGATWSMPILGFPDIPPGTSSSNSSLSLNSTGNVLLYDTVFTATPPFYVSIPPGTSPCSFGIGCAPTVIFNPTQLGTYTGTLTASIHGATYSLPLKGTATNESSNAFFEQGSVTFDETWVGFEETRTVTLTNAGNGALSIYYSTFLQKYDNYFSQANDCGTSLAPGSSCHFFLTFAPPQDGSYYDLFQIVSSGSARLQIPLYAGGMEVWTAPSRPTRPVRTPSSSSNPAIHNNLLRPITPMLREKICGNTGQTRDSEQLENECSDQSTE